MKISLAVLLSFIFILPMFGSWMSHDVIKEIHIQQEDHHQAFSHHAQHTHELQETASPHLIGFDLVTYFNDYLHVDLRSPDNVSVGVQSFNVLDIDHAPIEKVEFHSIILSSNVQARGPPVYSSQIVSLNTPVYLATQRLRI